MQRSLFSRALLIQLKQPIFQRAFISTVNRHQSSRSCLLASYRNLHLTQVMASPQGPDATYEDIKALPSHPEKVLIDVRKPQELQEFGQIPTSINIPLAELESALKLTPDAFKQQFGRDKPSTSTEIIFHCLKGGRAQTATDEALKQGFTNVRNYRGSWTDWAQHEGLKF